MKNWFFNLSIKFKILLLFYAILALFSSAFYFYSTSTASKSIISNVSNANLLLLQQISANISFMQLEVEDMSTQLILQPQVQSYIKPSDNNQDYEQKMYIDMNIKNAVNLIVSKNYINSLAICGFKNNTIPFLRTVDKNFVFPPVSVLSEIPLFQQALAANGKPVWLELKKEESVFGGKSRHKQLMMARVIKEYNTYENMGLLLIGINEPAIRRIYTKGISVENCAIALLNEQGEPFSMAGIDLNGKITPDLWANIDGQTQGYCIETLGAQEMLVTYSRDKDSPWTFIYAVPLSILTRQIDNSQNYILLFFFGAVVFLFPLILFASELIIRPIRKLLRIMRRFQTGDFNAFISFRYHDEIGQLGDGYNEMVRNVQTLIDQMYVLELKEREAELTALQAQINPHFLYNTLDSIYWKAKKNHQDDIAEMVWYLSNIFRMSLNKGRRFNSITYEFEFLEQYLRLQQLRHSNQIHYKIEMDPTVQDLEIPKLIIQPFVENAIKHGLERKNNTGNICVSCRLEADNLIFCITDDGMGMDAQTAEQLQSGTYVSKNEMNGYAIKNIQERLSLVYGTSYHLSIHSQPLIGTRVDLILPAAHHPPTVQQGGNHL